MTISEVSEKYGLPADTLRYYEKAGLIPPVNRKESGVRDYTDARGGTIHRNAYAICNPLPQGKPHLAKAQASANCRAGPLKTTH